MSNSLPTNDACQGCFVNANWTPNWPDPNINWPQPMDWPNPSIPQPAPNFSTFYPTYQWFTTSGLTVEEQMILKQLADAYSAFKSLDAKHPDDDDEFKDAIHAAQKIIALRVARRVDPHIWFQPETQVTEEQSTEG